jgi:hypothetical protein
MPMRQSRGFGRRGVGAALLAIGVAAILAMPAAAAVGRFASAAIPSSFRALSVSFISTTEGWVLGSVTCGAAHCPALVHTRNGGATWSTVPVPATAVTAYRDLDGSTYGVSTVVFANAKDGWLFDPELWATHDGGRTWIPLTVPGALGGEVLALAAANGRAHLVFYDNNTHFRIESTAVHSDAWTLAHRALSVGAGPVPTIQIALAGSGGWILQNDRTVVNGARLVGGTWSSWTPACASVIGPAYLAAASSSTLFAACDVGLWSTPAGEHLYRSTNGGASFSRVGATLPTYPGDSAAAGSSSTILVAGIRGSGEVVNATFNGGLSWHQVLRLSSAPRDLAFVGGSRGVLVSGGRLYLSADGGHTWRRATL